MAVEIKIQTGQHTFGELEVGDFFLHKLGSNKVWMKVDDSQLVESKIIFQAICLNDAFYSMMDDCTVVYPVDLDICATLK